MSKVHHLIRAIEAMRMAASTIYDRGEIMNISPEETAKSIAPLAQKMQTMINHAVEHDLAQALFAIQDLRGSVKKLNEQIRSIEEKRADLIQHIASLETAVMGDLETRGIESRMDEGYSVTLIKENGRNYLKIR